MQQQQQPNPNQIGGDLGLLNNLSGYQTGAQKSPDTNTFDVLDQSLLRNQSKNMGSNRNGGELSEISMDLFNRLLKTSVIRASPETKTLHDRKVVILDGISTARFQNGLLFGSYLIVLKEVLYKVNQDFSVDDKLLSNLKE